MLQLEAELLGEVVPEVEEAVAYSELNPVFVEQQAQAAVPPGPEEVEVEPSVALALALPVVLSADFHHPVDLDLTVALEQVEEAVAEVVSAEEVVVEQPEAEVASVLVDPMVP